MRMSGSDHSMLTRICVTFILALILWPGQIVFAAPKLEGTRWRLVEVNGAEVPTLANGKQPSLMLDAAQKKATGYAGCNNFFAAYALDGSSLSFGPVGATRRACQGPETAVETAFLKAMSGTRGWNIRAGELFLLAGGEVLARFTAGKKDEVEADPGTMTYRSKSFPSGTVTLSAGEYRMPAAPGSASEMIIKLTDKKIFGSVQGREMGVVVLVTSLGGTGSFYELALLVRGATGWENTDTVTLGDRVKVHSVRIENDRIVVAMTVHGPNDPLCCPTREVKKLFTVQNDRLTPIAEEKPGLEPRIDSTTWQWMQSFYNNDTKTVPQKPENYTIRFLENGNIAVKADCNQKGGTYSTEGRKLSITVTHSTLAACEPGSLEDVFVRDLEAAAIFFFKDGSLYIDLKYDTGTIIFTRLKDQ
jgi:heat shock protein HslJ